MTNQDKTTGSADPLHKASLPNVNPDPLLQAVGKVSSAARGLCLWVRAMETYGNTAKDIAPKRARLQTAQDQLAKKQAALGKAQAKLQEVLAQVASLRVSVTMPCTFIHEEPEGFHQHLSLSHPSLYGHQHISAARSNRFLIEACIVHESLRICAVKNQETLQIMKRTLSVAEGVSICMAVKTVILSPKLITKLQAGHHCQRLGGVQEKYEESTLRKRALEDELQDLEAKLNRAQKLLSGLAGERVRWEGSIVTLAASIDALPGDVALAAAFLSYAGPFPGNFRTQMVVDQWQKQVITDEPSSNLAPGSGATFLVVLCHSNPGLKCQNSSWRPSSSSI